MMHVPTPLGPITPLRVEVLLHGESVARLGHLVQRVMMESPSGGTPPTPHIWAAFDTPGVADLWILDRRVDHLRVLYPRPCGV
jgi:hypothetical protein